MATIAWLPKSLDQVLGSHSISTLQACAQAPFGIHTPHHQSGQPATNHWVLRCVLSNGKTVQINPSPSGSNMSMVLIVTCPEDEQDDTVRSIVLQNKPTTVHELLDFLKQHGLDRYKFNFNGQGCRYWTASVIKALDTHGPLQEGIRYDDLTSDLECVWTRSGELAPEAEQTKIDAGTFYG